MDTQVGGAITPEVMPKEVPQEMLAVIKANGLEMTSAEYLEKVFGAMIADAKKWEEKAKAIKVTSCDQVADMKMARIIRLELRNIRCGAENTRKSLNEDGNRRKKAVDGIYALVENITKPLETYLEDQEKFAERENARLRSELQASRMEVVKPLAEVLGGDAEVAKLQLADMSEAQFNSMVSGAQMQLRARREAEAKAELDRIEAERQKAEEEECQKAEQARRLKEAEEKAEEERKAREAAEAKAKTEREAAELLVREEKAKTDAELKAAQEKAAAELKAAQDKAAAEKAKADAKLAEIEAKAKAEREEQARLLAEAEAKVRAEREERERREAEAKAIAEAEQAERERREAEAAAIRKAELEAAEKAPDKDKMNAFAVKLMVLGNEVPEMSSEVFKAHAEAVRNRVKLLADWVVTLK